MIKYLQRLFSNNKFLHKTLGKYGYSLSYLGDNGSIPESWKRIYLNVKPYTMISEAQIYKLLDCTDYIHKNNIPGDIVETGVWRGGAMLAVGMRLNHLGSNKSLWLFNTFKGLPEPTDIDGTKAKDLYKEYKGKLCVSELTEVKQVMGILCNRTAFVEGDVLETVPKQAPSTIALLHIDTDWYVSVKHTLIHLYPRVVKGGFIIIDDYNGWEGCKKAVDEYFEENKLTLFLHRVDCNAVMIIKP